MPLQRESKSSGYHTSADELPEVHPDEINGEFAEGATRQVSVNRYEQQGGTSGLPFATSGPCVDLAGSTSRQPTNPSEHEASTFTICSN